MNIKNGMIRLYAVVTVLFFLMQYPVSAQEENKNQQGKNTDNSSKSIQDMGIELTANLNLSHSQESRLNDILKDFQYQLSGTAGINSNNKTADIPDAEKTNKAKVDKTEVRDQSTNNRDVSVGSAKTKNETNDAMTGRGEHAVVSFERARIDADSRIEEMLTPEQAIKYGKIKSDWWDKVREKTHPGSLSK